MGKGPGMILVDDLVSPIFLRQASGYSAIDLTSPILGTP